MAQSFPAAVPEIPVDDVDRATEYYRERLGFTVDWGGAEGGIAGVSRGDCRLFLTSAAFREGRGNAAPIVVWINLDGRGEVDRLYDAWKATRAHLLSLPEAKPWQLYEFTAADADGNLMRVFHDFGWETRSE